MNGYNATNPIRGHLRSFHSWEPDWIAGQTDLELVEQHTEAHNLEQRYEGQGLLYKIAYHHSSIDLTIRRP